MPHWSSICAPPASDAMNILFSVLGIVSGFAMVWILNKMPDKAFCDYDETPDERHKAPRAGKRAIALCAAALAVVYGILGDRFGLGVKSVFVCVSCTVLLMVLLSDVRYCIIPDELIIAGCLFATVGAFPDILSGGDFLDRLSPVFGAAIGAGMIFLINCLGQLLYKKDALGMGDLKLMAVCGILCGTTGTVIALLIGILAAGIWFAAAIALKRVRSEEYMPLGPFLVFGTLFTLCLRPAIDAFLAWYISLI